MNLHVIDTGLFKLDGGAMFGVVPKTLWSKGIPPDEKNLCTWAMRCLLVEDGDRLILIDNGIGDKQDAKFFSHYDLHGEDTLEGSLKKAGFNRDDVTDVLLTHLHFDHCGGSIVRQASGFAPAFKNATYWSNEHHWQWATKPNAREKASFLTENILPIQESGQLKFVDVFRNLADLLPDQTQRDSVANIDTVESFITLCAYEIEELHQEGVNVTYTEVARRLIDEAGPQFIKYFKVGYKAALHWMRYEHPDLHCEDTDESINEQHNKLRHEYNSQLMPKHNVARLLDRYDVAIVNGHTESMMIPMIPYKGRTVAFMADLLPSAHHIPLPWVMGYDTRPLLTLEEKRSFLERAADENIVLFFEHDATNQCATVERTEKGIRLKETFPLSAL